MLAQNVVMEAISALAAQRLTPPGLEARVARYPRAMCRSIKRLREPHGQGHATDEEIREAALQFVRKVSGFTAPSSRHEEAFKRRWTRWPTRRSGSSKRSRPRCGATRDRLPARPSPEQMRAMGEAAIEYVIGFIHGLSRGAGPQRRRRPRGGPRAAAVAPGGGRVVRRGLRAVPRRGGAGLRDVRARATCPYVPGGGLYASALGQFLAMSVNRFPNLWEVAPGLVQIEQNVIRWLCDLFGYPDEARGILTTGGSIANLSAVVTARHVKLGEDFADGTYYVSEQAHASVPKAAAIAGMPAARDAPRAGRRRAPDGRRGAEGDGGRGPRRRPPTVPRRAGRRDHEHRRDRSDGRGGRRRRGGGPVDARRRRVRRLLPPHGARSTSGSRGSSAPTRSRSTRTRGCSCPTGPARSSSATARRSATPTTSAPSTSRTARRRPSCPTGTSTRRSCRGTTGGSASGSRSCSTA